MFTSGYRPALILALCLGTVLSSSAERGLRLATPKRSVMSVRLVARVPLESVSSLGLNHESYIAEVAEGDKLNAGKLIKLSYRFDQRDPRLPNSFLDYALTHTFRVTRDEDCDESWESISTRFLFDKAGNFQGKRSALVYASNAPVATVPSQLTLTCYSATPQDYRATVKSKVPPPAAVAASTPAVQPAAPSASPSAAPSAAQAAPKKNGAGQTLVSKTSSH